MTFATFSSHNLRLLALALVLPLLQSGCEKPEEKAKKAIEAQGKSLIAGDFVAAARAGDPALVQLFLDAGMQPNALDNMTGYTALMAAAEEGGPSHKSVIEELLAADADPNKLGVDQNTAIMLAIEKSHPDIVRALLASTNINLDIPNKDEFKPLTLAAFKGDSDIVRLLQPRSSAESPRALLVSSVVGHTDVVKALLDGGAPVNATIDDQRQTPLMKAAINGHLEVAKLLFQYKADPKLVDKDGKTALILAIENRHPDVAALIDATLKDPSYVPAETPATPIPATPTAPDVANPANPTNSLVATTPTAPTTPPASPLGGLLPAVPTETSSKEKPEDFLKRYNITGGATNDLMARDSDNDGFTNQQEYDSGTSPIRPDSYPTAAAPLRLKKITSQALPVRLLRTAPGAATISVEGGAQSVQVHEGETLPGLDNFEVTSISSGNDVDKFGKPVEISRIVLTDKNTGQPVTLARDMTADSPESVAEITLAATGETKQVRRGEEFSFTGLPNQTFSVVDFRPTQVIVKEVATGRMFTLER